MDVALLSCSLAAVLGSLGSLEEGRAKMVGAVERQPDQRWVTGIRTGCLSTAFPWVAPRGGSLLCLQQPPGEGHTLNRHRQEPRPATWWGPARWHWRFLNALGQTLDLNNGQEVGREPGNKSWGSQAPKQ